SGRILAETSPYGHRRGVGPRAYVRARARLRPDSTLVGRSRTRASSTDEQSRVGQVVEGHARAADTPASDRRDKLAPAADANPLRRWNGGGLWTMVAGRPGPCERRSPARQVRGLTRKRYSSGRVRAALRAPAPRGVRARPPRAGSSPRAARAGG